MNTMTHTKGKYMKRLFASFGMVAVLGLMTACGSSVKLDDEKGGADLRPILGGQRVERRRVAGQLRVDQVRAKHRQAGNEIGLDCGFPGSSVHQPRECQASRKQAFACALHRAPRDDTRGHDDSRPECERDEQTHAQRDVGLHATMPADAIHDGETLSRVGSSTSRRDRVPSGSCTRGAPIAEAPRPAR